MIKNILAVLGIIAVLVVVGIGIVIAVMAGNMKKAISTCADEYGIDQKRVYSKEKGVMDKYLAEHHMTMKELQEMFNDCVQRKLNIKVKPEEQK